jgi:hypothetical protein
MAIRRSVERVIVVDGPRNQWISRCEHALQSGGFSAVEANTTLNQIEGTYHKVFVWGEILVTLLPEGANTRIVAKATANVDNIWALFSSPTKKILTVFKAGLG